MPADPVNPKNPGGVLLFGTGRQALMKLAAATPEGATEGAEDAVSLTAAGGSVSTETLEQEFSRRLADSSRLAFRVALGVLRNAADAEDVAQEAFVRAYRNFHRLRDRESFRAWLVRITWRLALDYRRSSIRRERREVASAAGEDASPSVEELAISAEFQARLAKALDALPERLRQAVILAALEGHELRDVARWLGIPEGTVKSRLFKARKKLAELLR